MTAGVALQQPVDYKRFEDLPVAAAGELYSAVRQLSRENLYPAMRLMVIPVKRANGAMEWLVGDAAGFDHCRRKGLAVSRRAQPQQITDAIQSVFAGDIMAAAVDRLYDSHPELSAKKRLNMAQSGIFLVCGLVLAAAIIAGASWPGHFIHIGLMMLFLGLVLLRGAASYGALNRFVEPGQPLSDNDLPHYTVLVPIFRESRIFDQLIKALNGLDYPHDKLDIFMLLEEHDQETWHAVEQCDLPPHFRILCLPAGSPQTKPRALNYGLQFSRGELVTVYDAEDIPARGQLRRAAAIFAANPPKLACLQAALTYYNARDNWLTRQFTVEYAVLFDLLLPFLSSLGLPLMLGGTSNHFKTAHLRKAGGWDPFNVTEDADLGIRLSRFGYQVAAMRSTTREEAASTFGTWLPQRARWIKGWTQTYLVHMRHPLALLRDLGWHGFVGFQLVMGCTLFSTFAHPFFLAAIMYGVISQSYLMQTSDPMVHLTGGISLAVLIAGYGVMMYSSLIAVQRRRLRDLARSIATMPFYWLLISLGAWLALWQFVRAPHHWNKTPHGLAKKQSRQILQPHIQRRTRAQ